MARGRKPGKGAFAGGCGPHHPGGQNMKILLLWKEGTGVGYRKTQFPEPSNREEWYPDSQAEPSYSSQSMDWWLKHECPQLEAEGRLIIRL